MTSTPCKWSKEDIRAARAANLPALLLKHGVPLRETGGGNFQLLDPAGVLLKDSYWRWPERDLQGNAIDFFVKVLGRSFAQAMTAILG